MGKRLTTKDTKITEEFEKFYPNFVSFAVNDSLPNFATFASLRETLSGQFDDWPIVL